MIWSCRHNYTIYIILSLSFLLCERGIGLFVTKKERWVTLTPCPDFLGCEWMLPAPASLHDHVLIIFEHDFFIFVHVEHGDGRKLRGDATGLGDCGGVD